MKIKYKKPVIKTKKIRINFFYSRRASGFDTEEMFLAVTCTCERRYLQPGSCTTGCML